MSAVPARRGAVSLSSLDYAILAPYLAAMLCLMIFGLHRYVRIFHFRRLQRRPPAAADGFEQLPTLTVQLPLYNERYVAARLIDAVRGCGYAAVQAIEKGRIDRLFG